MEDREMKFIQLDDGTWAQAFVPVDSDGNILGGGATTVSLVLTDTVTGTKYNVTVASGVLTLTEV